MLRNNGVMTTFWGVRGSFPQPSPLMSQFGGHTSCVSLHVEPHLIILDAGTGLVDLSRWMKHENIKSATLLLSHFHYDHCLGLLFFEQLWDPSFALTILTSERQAETYLKKLISPPFVPFSFSDFPAQISFKLLHPDETLHLFPDVSLKTTELEHPGGSLGYRLQSLESENPWSLVYLNDHTYPPLNASKAYIEKILTFTHQADLLIQDSHFTEEEWKRHESWGHTSWQKAVHLASEAQVKQLALFHHHPDREDAELLAIEQEAQNLFHMAFVARQGQSLLLAAHAPFMPCPPTCTDL